MLIVIGCETAKPHFKLTTNIKYDLDSFSFLKALKEPLNNGPSKRDNVNRPGQYISTFYKMEWHMELKGEFEHKCESAVTVDAYREKCYRHRS